MKMDITIVDSQKRYNPNSNIIGALYSPKNWQFTKHINYSELRKVAPIEEIIEMLGINQGYFKSLEMER